jgi:thiamine-monophosphate kinase
MSLTEHFQESECERKREFLTGVTLGNPGMSSKPKHISPDSRAMSELGESGIIDWICRNGPARPREDVIRAIGDDCAVLQFTDANDLLVTTDTMVEGTHFTAQTLPPDALGWKLLASNISDIAAMGGIPKTAFLSLAWTGNTSTGFMEAFIAGLTDLAQQTDIVLAGGDTVESPAGDVVTLTLLGECRHGRAIYRNGARTDDDIWVSGYLGNAAGGLFILKRGLSEEMHARPALIEAHQTPTPRVELGKRLAQSGLIHAMIDLSDGISTDLSHICRQSGVGATLDRSAIPISKDLKQLGERTGQDPEQWALHGGEDYELLFTAPSSHRKKVETLGGHDPTLRIHRIGKIIQGTGVSLVDETAQADLIPGGYSHFSTPRQTG